MGRLSSVCRSFLTSLTGAALGRRATPRFRPRLESLEERQLLHFSHLIHFATLPQYVAYGQDHSQTQQGSLNNEVLLASLPWQGPGYYVYFPSQAAGLSPWRHFDTLGELNSYKAWYAGQQQWDGIVLGPYMTQPNQSRAHIHGASRARGGHTALAGAGRASAPFGGIPSSSSSSPYGNPYSYPSPVSMYNNPYGYPDLGGMYGGSGGYLSPFSPYSYWW